VRSGEVATNVGLNFVNALGLSVMTGAGSANQALTAEDVLHRAEPLLPDVEYLYLSSCIKLKRLLPAYETLAEAAKTAKTKIVVDHGRLNSHTTPEDAALVRELVRHADYYFPSRDEFLELWGAETIEAVLRSRDWGGTIVAVKDGPNGAYGWADGKLLHVPAYPAQPVNTVGAGDSFNAGVMAAVRQGSNLKTALQYGCATAAIKISRPGLPDWAAVEALVLA
jgi:ribokinase